jgi:hypothetical protein
VDLVEVTSEGGAIDEAFDAQGTLVDVGEMRLYVKDSLERVVGPVDAVSAGVAAAGLQGLRLIHVLGESDEWCGE